ncbi:MAG: HPr family phosphocarrier protein [Propionicimonas sp.]|nr:hypothetical protein [Propionicimonas sp.]MCG2804512.1 HPr family phosphocarrier protein [Propionicimonas sp.]
MDLALEMVHGERPLIALAAGTADGRIGTDPIRVSEAVIEVASPDGVLVFMDLGSAVLSAELALEVLGDPGFEVRLTSAPFVEGILAAIVSAAYGADLDRVQREASGALLAKRMHLGEEIGDPGSPEAGPVGLASSAEIHADVQLLNRDGLHARPAAMIMAALTGLDAVLRVQRRDAAEAALEVTGPTALMAVGGRQGDHLRFAAAGPDAEVALQRVGQLVADGFGESTVQACELAADANGSAFGVSPGRVAGRVVRMVAPASAPSVEGTLPDLIRPGEAARIDSAALAVAEELQARAGMSTATAGEILGATAEIARDVGLLGKAKDLVLSAGRSAERAVWEAYDSLAADLRARGGLAAERAADVIDVRDRIVANLEGRTAQGLPDEDEPYVLVAEDLSPADTALLDPTRCLALVTEQGGPTSHTAILARSLGIPAVVAAAGVWSAPLGAVLLVDGTSGELIWDPDEASLAELAERPGVAAFSGRGATADDRPMPLLANVGSGEDARRAAVGRAEGVGLFRTEFCFLDRLDAPTVEEQVEAYREVLAAFSGRRVVIRTLDAGSDKPLSFVGQVEEANPALGVRGYRTSVTRPQLLDTQLLAIAKAAALESADVNVMAPMITTVEEAAAFVSRCHDHGIAKAGVMIETPAAALLADRLLPIVDFVSIGTNDLTQYVMAADRLVGSLASLNDPWQPAVLRLIERVGQAGQAAGVPVGVCGEAAANPHLAVVLTGLGVTSLSMTSRAIPAVADQLSRVDQGCCRAAARAAVAAATANQARSQVGGILGYANGGSSSSQQLAPYSAIVGARSASC